MKENIHPDYHPVVFMDSTTGFKFLSGSTKTSQETVEWEDGNTYPVIRVEVTSDSHPFYTGRQNSHKQTDVWTVSTKIRSQRRKRCGIIKTLITQRLADYLIGIVCFYVFANLKLRLMLKSRRIIMHKTMKN